EDAFRKRDHDEHQGDNTPLEGEKSAKKQKMSKILKLGCIGYPVIDEDEVIPDDETPELIKEFQNVDKRVPTIFSRKRIEATLRDMLSNQQEDLKRLKPNALVLYGPQRNLNEPPRYLYNKDLFFLKYGNSEEKRYMLSLHKIHAILFLEKDLEEKMNRWVKCVFKTFNEEAQFLIQHWKDSWHKRMYKIRQRKVRDDPEEVFSDYGIVEAVKVTTDKQFGLDYMKRIVVLRGNDKPDSFSEAGFNYLNKNDIEEPKNQDQP
ncbi:hypothetical protein Tco_0547689, partial [Tanacetum coccineum]